MSYSSLKACIDDLEKQGHLIRIKDEVDPCLQMAAIHLRVFEHHGPAILFENIKGSKFPAVSNLFGTLVRSSFIFRDSLDKVKTLVDLKSHPLRAIKNPFRYANVGLTALSALPKKVGKNAPVSFSKCHISDLPQIVNWPKDGGPFVTMPQVYTEDMDKPGIMNANLGMYRIQLAGNDYVINWLTLSVTPWHRRTPKQSQCKRSAAKSEHICWRAAFASGRRCDAVAGRTVRNDLRRRVGQTPFPLFL